MGKILPISGIITLTRPLVEEIRKGLRSLKEKEAKLYTLDELFR